VARRGMILFMMGSFENLGIGMKLVEIQAQ